MMEPRHAILPGIILAVSALLLFSQKWNLPNVVEAATQPPVPSAAEVSPDSEEHPSESCGLSPAVIEGVRQWCAQIEVVSARYGLDMDLVAAVMTQESGGQADIVSPSGAIGLMQVMPSDGIAASFMCMNGPCFAKRPTTQELLDAEFNLDYGTRMLAGLLEKYGNIRDALKAYGPYQVGYAYADKVLAIQASIEP